MVRVLHVIDSLIAGGKERQFVELLCALRQDAGIACEAVIMSDTAAYQEIFESGFKISFLPRRRRYDVSMFFRLFGLMRAFRPDIVQSWNSMCSVYSAPLARLVGARFVNGSLRGAPPQVSLRDPDYFRFRLILPMTDRVLSNSLAGLRSYSVPAAKAVCIRNGFNRKRLAGISSPDEAKRSLSISTANVVGMVANFTEKKDYSSFLEMAKRVLALRQDVTFVAVGEGPRLKAFQDRFPGEAYPRIRFPGRRTDVESVANAFTIGVLTSTAGEGISNAVMEFMALGKPVVATDIGGNAELIEEGQTGFLVGADDVDALTERVLRLLDDSALAKRFGECGRERIAREFGVDRMRRDYLEFYRDLLAGH